MLQRIQTVYMLLSVVVSAGLVFIVELWITSAGTVVFAKDRPLYIGLFLISAALSLFAVCLYKHRKMQRFLGYFNMLLNAILLVFFVCRVLNVYDFYAIGTISRIRIGIYLPAIAIVLLALANRAIKKDDALVRSADRLR